MNTSGRAFVVAILLVVMLAWSSPPGWAAPAPPSLLKVSAAVSRQSVRIEARAPEAFEFSTYRPSANLFIADLAGVTLEGSENARVLDSGVVSSYRLLQYRAGDRPIVRIEILLRSAVEPRIERLGENGLAIIMEGSSAGSTPSTDVSQAPEPRTKSPAKTVRATTNSPKPVVKAGGTTTIESVAVDTQDQQVRVRVEADNRLAYQALRLSQPDRLVLDFSGARLRGTQKTVSSTLEPVKAVRASQFKPDTARVVVDLSRGVPYSLSADATGLTVLFGSNGASQSGVTQPRTSPTSPVETTNSENSGAGTVPSSEIKADEKATGGTLQNSNPVAVKQEAPISNAVTPDTPVQTSSNTVAPSNISLGRPNASLKEAKLDVSPKESKPATKATAPTTPGNAPQGGSAGKYSGEPISVNLKDVDLKDFFRLIHEISGLNVVLEPNVKGSLTIVLDDVPWDQALDIVLQNNSLDKQLEGNVLRVATRETLKKEAETKRDLAKAEAEAVNPVTATRVLSYAKASVVRDTLKRFLSSRGDILADDRSNTLIIRDIPGVLPDLDTLIKQLDRKSQQVEIEARVVSASRTFAREIGTQFGISADANSGRNIFGGLAGNPIFTSPLVRGPALPSPPLVSSSSTAIPLNTALGAISPTSGLSYAFSSKNFALDFIISAAESRGVGKLLSKPRVITQNNEKAIVKQGTKIPVQTVINNTISTQFIDAVLKLEVTPQITADGTIYMEVSVENTQIDEGIPRVLGIPALDTQEADTKVLVNDGGTVVIGGVIISSQRTSVSQVPLLGSIPIVGHLFKHTTVSTSSQELLFFLTPRIVPS
jgi:type IV pilus secretin PilQ/predicted competence protein